MKNQSSWWKLLPVAVLAVSSCQKKENPQAQASASAEEAELPKIKALSPEERAKMLGFARYLSKDVDSVVSIYDGNEWAAKVKSLKAWKILLNAMSENSETDPEPQIAQVGDMLSKYLGQEFFIATGKGTSTQVKNLVTYSQRRNYYQFRSLTQAAVHQHEVDMQPAGATGDLELLNHLGEEIAWIQTLQMPPVLIGAKVADDTSMQQAKASFAQYLGMLPQFLGDAVEPIEFTKAGASFSGMKLKGESLAGFIEMARGQLADKLKPEDLDQLIEVAKKRNLVVAYGSLGQELMIYLGDDTESCPLVEKVEDSLCASSDVAFVDEWAGKKLSTFTFATSDLVRSGQAGAFSSIISGIEDGLKDTKIEGIDEVFDQFKIVMQKENELLSSYSMNAGGSVSFFEDGLKIECSGGVDMHMIDSKSKHQLEKLKDADGVVFFSDSAYDPQFTDKAMGYLEAVTKSAYLGAGKVANLEGIESKQFIQFQQGYKMFDENFRTDFQSIYLSLRSTEQALGYESATVVDLKGTVPPVPGIPQLLVDQGKFFRASVISPVKDRAKLSTAWDEIDQSLKSIFAKASSISGNQIAMQKPISSEKGDFITWFYSFPFFTNDFTPSVTLSNKWMILSTAKSQAIELGLAADKAAGTTKGSYAEFRLEPLVKFSRDWLMLIDQNSETVFPNQKARDEFSESMPTALKALDAMEDLKKITIHQRVERDQLRSSIYFSTH